MKKLLAKSMLDASTLKETPGKWFRRPREKDYSEWARCSGFQLYSQKAERPQELLDRQDQVRLINDLSANTSDHGQRDRTQTLILQWKSFLRTEPFERARHASSQEHSSLAYLRFVNLLSHLLYRLIVRRRIKFNYHLSFLFSLIVYFHAVHTTYRYAPPPWPNRSA